MKTEEIVDAARNAGFSSSEIMHRLAAFKRLIQYSTSAEREKCTGTQEFVTLPREVVEQALEALSNTGTQRGKQPSQFLAEGLSINALRAALEQPQNHVPDAGNMVPAGWKLVLVEPTKEMLLAFAAEFSVCSQSETFPTAYRAMLAAAPQPPVVEQPQANQPAMTPIAQRKLEDLMASGYTISGCSVYHEQKHQHGFVTGAGLVGWWKPDGMEYPQPQGEQEPVAEVTVSHVLPDLEGRCTAEIASRERLPVGAELFIHPQNLRCKSTQARLATLWGYVKSDQPQGGQEPVAKVVLTEQLGLPCLQWLDLDKQFDFNGGEFLYTHPQPKREPLTDECIYEISEDLKWYDGDCDRYDIYGIARAIEAAHNIK